MAPSGQVRSLRALIEDTDAEQFVGRDAELHAVRDLLDVRTPSRILLVHGPGGIGKSALLRAAAREASASGFSVEFHDARTLHGGVGDIVAALAGPHEGPVVLLLDGVEHMGSMLAPLSDALLDHLREDSRIVLAGRAEPGQTWRMGALSGIVVDLQLGPLADASAHAFLTQRGVVDEERRRDVVTWARGYPLALTVAASAPGGRAGSSMEAHLEERLTAWLAGRAMLDVDREVLEVAAIARVLDARLLAAALPGRNTRDLMPRVVALPVMQSLGSGVSMHPVLASAIRERVKATAPQRYRHLVRRIAEHLATRARLGDMEALIELSEMIEHPEYRRAIGNELSRNVYPDKPRPGEFETFSAAHGFQASPDAEEVRTWRSVGTEFVLRCASGESVLWVVLLPLSRLPLGGPIAHSHREVADRLSLQPQRSFAAVALFAEGSLEERDEASRLASGAFMRHAAVPDLEVILMSFPEPNRRPGSNAIDTEEIDDAGPRAVVVSDFRPLGAVGFVEAIVLREHGFEPRGAGAVALLAATNDPERETRLRAVLDKAFGDSPDDKRLRAIMEAAHLGGRRSEASLLAEFHVGRSTWYRLLRTARERVLSQG